MSLNSTNAVAGASPLGGLARAVELGEARRHSRQRVVSTRAAAEPAAPAGGDELSIGRPSYLDHPDPASFAKPASVLHQGYNDDEGDAVAGGIAGGVRRKHQGTAGKLVAAAVMTVAALAAPLAANAARVPAAPAPVVSATPGHW